MSRKNTCSIFVKYHRVICKNNELLSQLSIDFVIYLYYCESDFLERVVSNLYVRGQIF